MWTVSCTTAKKLCVALGQHHTTLVLSQNLCIPGVDFALFFVFVFHRSSDSPAQESAR